MTRSKLIFLNWMTWEFGELEDLGEFEEFPRYVAQVNNMIAKTVLISTLLILALGLSLSFVVVEIRPCQLL